MKYLTVIWGMIMFLLACLPCTDSGIAFAHPDDSSSIQLDHSHNNAPEETDPCSPLCECKCCGGISLAVHSASLAPPVEALATYISPYHIVNIVSPSYPFWHPPRV